MPPPPVQFSHIEVSITTAERDGVNSSSILVSGSAVAVFVNPENPEGEVTTSVVDSLKLEMTGATPITFTKVSSWTHTFTSFPPGPKTILATAHFSTHFKSDDKTIEDTPPVITVDEPAPNQLVRGAGPTFPV